jgi:hypothetical protein
MSMSAGPENSPEKSPEKSFEPGGALQHIPRAKAERRSFVVTMIAMAVLLFVATEALLYFRWATMTEPTCLLIIDTAEPARGAEIEVDGVMLSQPHKVVLGDHDRFSIPFYLEPGQYTVKLLMNNEPFFHTDVQLTREQRGLRLDLRKLVPPAAPTTLPTTTPSSPLFPSNL